MSPAPLTGTARYITERLPLRAPPGLPGMRLHLAAPESGLGAFLATHDGGTPYWAYAWPGGLTLARHLFAHPECVRARRVLDFGAGSGLVAIAAMLCGASQVLAVDTDPLAETTIALNAAANGVAVRVHIGQLDPDAVEADLVLAADTFYAADVAAKAMDFLLACAGRGKQVLIGDIGRSHLPVADLTVLASYPVPDVGDAEPIRTGNVFTLRS